MLERAKNIEQEDLESLLNDLSKVLDYLNRNNQSRKLIIPLRRIIGKPVKIEATLESIIYQGLYEYLLVNESFSYAKVFRII